ncbi:MAG: PQQ-binding-like beta-propeller repeat protein [Planctomycetota bacterium]
MGRLISITICFCLGASASADWKEFRGQRGASAVDTSLPIQFGGEQNERVDWKTELPGRAVNGAIVIGDQVIATSSSGKNQKRLHVFSLNDETGQVQWERRLWATGRTLCHPLSAMAAPTPASDGEAIFAFFATNDLVCLSLDGDVRWIRALSLEYPGAFDDRGLASSPCLAGDTLVVQIACEDDSNVFGIDKQSGKTKWVLPIAKSTNWASPCEILVNGRPMVMLQSAERLIVLDPESGDEWGSYEAEGNLIPSPAFADGLCLLPANGMTALRLQEAESDFEVLWEEAKVAAEATSPVIAGEHFFVIRSPNLLTAARLADGDVVWKARLEGSGFWATPLVAGEQLYVPNTDGTVHVVRLEDGEVLASNEFNTEILGSPAASDEALYLRATDAVIKVGGPS